MPAKATERPKTVENITVLQVGEFGVRVGEKLWFGVNEPLTPQHFVPNTAYKVSVVVSKTGKKYICDILGTEDKGATTDAPTGAKQLAPVKAAEEALAKAKTDAATKAAATASASKTTTTDKHPTRAGYDKPLTEYDLSKDRQISRSGVYQAALQSPALAQWAVNIDEYLALVRKAADAGTKYISE